MKCYCGAYSAFVIRRHIVTPASLVWYTGAGCWSHNCVKGKEYRFRWVARLVAWELRRHVRGNIVAIEISTS